MLHRIVDKIEWGLEKSAALMCLLLLVCRSFNTLCVLHLDTGNSIPCPFLLSLDGHVRLGDCRSERDTF